MRKAQPTLKQLNLNKLSDASELTHARAGARRNALLRGIRCLCARIRSVVVQALHPCLGLEFPGDGECGRIVSRRVGTRRVADRRARRSDETPALRLRPVRIRDRTVGCMRAVRDAVVRARRGTRECRTTGQPFPDDGRARVDDVLGHRARLHPDGSNTAYARALARRAWARRRPCVGLALCFQCGGSGRASSKWGIAITFARLVKRLCRA